MRSHLRFPITRGNGPTPSPIKQMARGWIVGLGLPLADEYFGHISNIGHISSHNPGRFFTCLATSIPGWGLYAPNTYPLCDSHICLYVTLPTRAPLPLDARTINMVLSKSTCTTFVLQIANSEEHFYIPCLSHPCPQATIPASKKLLWDPFNSAPLGVYSPRPRVPLWD